MRRSGARATVPPGARCCGDRRRQPPLAGRPRCRTHPYASSSSSSRTASDFQHFAAIHGRLRIPWTEIPVPGMTIHHEATWRRDETQKHVCWFGNDATLAFRGRLIEGSGAHADVRLEGPGSVIRFDFTLSRGRGRVVLYQSHTPIAPLTQHVRFRWFSETERAKAACILHRRQLDLAMAPRPSRSGRERSTVRTRCSRVETVPFTSFAAGTRSSTQPTSCTSGRIPISRRNMSLLRMVGQTKLAKNAAQVDDR